MFWYFTCPSFFLFPLLIIFSQNDTGSDPPPPFQKIKSYIFRNEDSGASVKEMDDMAETGEKYYQESGTVFKLAGVLRAADIFWNTEKRQVY
jgi:hypothetical protein